MPALIALLKESKRFMSNIAHACVLASPDPFLSEGLEILRQGNHVCSVGHETRSV
jgi:hypothetical protein